MLGEDRFFQWFFSLIFDVRPLVLENGASGPPKTCVLQGFHVKLLFWLEVSGANAVPVLGGDRFFDAILPLRLRVDFRIDQCFYRKKVSKKEPKRLRNWKA